MRLTVSEAFGALRAEDEPWLESCFVAPTDYERLLSARSDVIFGGIGSGKTALYHAIKRHNAGPDGEPLRLLVDWRMSMPAVIDRERAAAAVRSQVQHLFDLCAVQLATHIVHFPKRLQGAPDWVKQRINWFIQGYMTGEPSLRLGPVLARSLPGTELLNDLLNTTPTTFLYAQASPLEVIDELLIALEQIGLQGVLFLVDDIERHAYADETMMLEMLNALLGTLPLFERSGFVFKLFVPERFEGIVSKASGFERRRISGVRLRHTEIELRQIVNRRLQLVTGDPTFHLGRLYLEDELVTWLKAAGGHSPRHWLDQVYPLISSYVTHGLDRMLTQNEWDSLRQSHPPQFFFMPDRKRVIVGGREMTLDQVPPNAVNMLGYLFDHSNDIVTRDRLYFLAFKDLKSLPGPGDKEYEAQNEYRGTFDTAIWRLRNAIEPDPKFPVLLETKRGHGFLLHVRF